MYKKLSHTNKSCEKPSNINNPYEKIPHTNNMYKKPSHTNNLRHFIACILLDFKKYARKTHTFLRVPQTYTQLLFILKLILKETICIKKPSHTNNLH